MNPGKDFRLWGASAVCITVLSAGIANGQLGVSGEKVTIPKSSKNATSKSGRIATGKSRQATKRTPVNRNSRNQKSAQGIRTTNSRTGGFQARPVVPGPPRILAQLGLVVADRLEVRVSQEPGAKILSIVEKGTHLAVVRETPDFYGVLMVNNTVGWVPRATLELINYRAEISVPALKEEPKAQTSQERMTRGLSLVQQAILRESFTYLGVPYLHSGNTRSGIDAPTFVKSVFATVGVSLPTEVGDQITVGRAVQGPDLQPGDRLYFDVTREGYISHTGIYIGNGLFIHASNNQQKVGVDSIFKKIFYNALVCARRDFGEVRE